MAVELYRDPQHACLMFTDLVEEDGLAVQSNQFLVIDDDVGALIDPGGNLAFHGLFASMAPYFAPQRLSYLLASHADPDIIASLDQWMTSTRAALVISRIWERFAPHFTKVGQTQNRIIAVPDEGARLPLGRSTLWLVPAHFLHAEGNFHFYDPVSRILFTGDLGASMVSGAQASQPVRDLAPHLPHMEAFHRRYMVSNKILRLWARMARQLDIAMLVPQHGAPIQGAQAIADFYDWLDQLACGIDLMDTRAYQLPRDRIDPATRRTMPPTPAPAPSLVRANLPAA